MCFGIQEKTKLINSITLLLKYLPAIILSFLSVVQRNDKMVYDLTISYRPAVINIQADTGLLYSTFVTGSGDKKITYASLKAGQYKVQICGPGQMAVVKDGFIVKEGQSLVLSLNVDGPCLYEHPAGYIPTCPQNHRDSIIPIIYGLIAFRKESFVKDKKDMKVKYAGCVVTDCDPQFYCKEHDIEF